MPAGELIGLIIIGLIAGVMSGMFGIGGGFITVMMPLLLQEIHVGWVILLMSVAMVGLYLMGLRLARGASSGSGATT